MPNSKTIEIFFWCDKNNRDWNMCCGVNILNEYTYMLINKPIN